MKDEEIPKFLKNLYNAEWDSSVPNDKTFMRALYLGYKYGDRMECPMNHESARRGFKQGVTLSKSLK
jgi:hypothetical protein